MSRQDYIALARAFARSRPHRYALGEESPLRWQWEQSLIAVMAELQKDNPKFSPVTFLRAAHEGDPGYDDLELERINFRRRAYADQNRLQP